MMNGKILDLGFGSKDVVVSRIPEGSGCWTLIRDDDAATVGAGAWYAYQATAEEAETEHEKEDGTVSALYKIVR